MLRLLIKSQKKVTPSCCDGGGGGAPKAWWRGIDWLFSGSLAVLLPLYLLYWFGLDAIAPYPWLVMMVHGVHQIVHDVWWGVVLGAVFIGILAKIPQKFILKILGEGGTLSGLLRAVFAGVLLDLCSHGILMIGAKLYQKGASAGQLMAFLLASPWNSFSLTLILFALVGLKLTLLYILLSMVIALITGLVFDLLVARGKLPANPQRMDRLDDFNWWQEARLGLRQTQFTPHFIMEMMWQGIKDSKMVLRWLLFGILMTVILRAVIDQDQFQTLFGPSFVGLLLTLGVATLLEVCSEGSAPIAADIVNRGGAPGNGFAFLMAGVATDYTELMVVKDTAKSWRIALFLPLISVPQILIIAWLLN